MLFSTRGNHLDLKRLCACHTNFIKLFFFISQWKPSDRSTGDTTFHASLPPETEGALDPVSKDTELRGRHHCRA